MIMQHAPTMLTELAKGLLRLGLDRLGDKGSEDGAGTSGGLTVEACHPYGLRSRPRDPDIDAAGTAKGAGLLLFEFGGGDEGGMPTQDPRVTNLPDEGKGGVILYGWTGAAVAHVRIDGPTGAVIITPAAGQVVRLDGLSEVGGAGGMAIAKAPPLTAWALQVEAALAAVAGLMNAAPGPVMSAPGAVPPVTPLPSTVAATRGTVV